MGLPKRKNIRLPEYDYSRAGYYFITICLLDNKCMLTCRGEQCSPAYRQPSYLFPLSDIGEIVENAIRYIPKYYPNVRVDKYVIMPNHIHMILVIDGKNDGRTLCAPTVSRIVKQLKEYVTKQTGFSIWQRSFHDRIIRNENEYREVWEYIDTNPLKWEVDRYYAD